MTKNLVASDFCHSFLACFHTVQPYWFLCRQSRLRYTPI